MLNNPSHILIYFLLALGILSGCQLDSASQAEQRELVIASDYLTQNDTILFTDFTKKHNIRVQLLELREDVIIQTLNSKPFNSNIDVILSKSLYTVNKLHKDGLLHHVTYKSLLDKKYHPYTSETYNYVGIGLNPFVLIYDKDSLTPVKTYNDLTRFSFASALSDDQTTVLLSPVLKRMRKVNAHNWIKKFSQRAHTYQHLPDSIRSSTPILAEYSSYQQALDKGEFKYKQILYANKNSTGTIFDLHTFSIVNQASNFTEAKLFLDFIVSPENQKKINRDMRTISPLELPSGFRRYQIHADEIMPYFSMTERVLEKL